MKKNSSERMPALFIGHGNPMNALRDTPFTRRLAEWGRALPRPTAILCISAHWITRGSWITGMAQPRTIHDFLGFPQELFDVHYPAPGSPATANLIHTLIEKPPLEIDHDQWGLDHGTWSVLRHLFPAADIPVLQLSLDGEQSAAYHFELGQQLEKLRDQGIMIIGSGNIVHNLRQVDFDDNAPPLPWALEFDAWVKSRLDDRDFSALIQDATQSVSRKLSIPTPEHWLPLLTVLGASAASDTLKTEYEGIENASMSMRCLGFYV